MTGPEQCDEAADETPKAPVKRVKRPGLSPAVEKMFGALVNEQAPAAAEPASDPEAQRAPRPGAA